MSKCAIIRRKHLISNQSDHQAYKDFNFQSLTSFFIYFKLAFLTNLNVKNKTNYRDNFSLWL